jgi:hypothetical protein
MRQQHSAARPNLSIHIGGLRKGLGEPADHPLEDHPRLSPLSKPCPHCGLHESMQGHGRLTPLQFNVLHERYSREGHQRFGEPLLVRDIAGDEIHRNTLRCHIGTQAQQPLRRRTFRRCLLDC